uniref:Uncharacterized protein n=1 Tax=Aegilops tauschii subsp. strangulata TaxID=200361 RepID=A0A453MXT7_AEGTS
MSPLCAHCSFCPLIGLVLPSYFEVLLFGVKTVLTTMQATYSCSLFEMLVLSDNVLWSVWHNFHHCEANDYCLSYTKI